LVKKHTLWYVSFFIATGYLSDRGTRKKRVAEIQNFYFDGYFQFIMLKLIINYYNGE
jgi:hypothetical protein